MSRRALVAGAQKFGYIKAQPRSFSSLGLCAPYDGNIVGGMVLGTGMLLAGACPGTVLVQLSLGVRSGFYALQGAIIAGIVWSGFLRRRTLRGGEVSGPKLTVHEGLGVRRSTVLIAFEAACAVAVAAAATLTTLGPEAKISPVVSGLLVAAAQLVSIALTKSLVGASASYEEVGDWFWAVLRGKGAAPQPHANVVFCTGTAAGAWLLGTTFPTLAPASDLTISPLAAGLGGFLMVLGSRMAGGCTSGHGISGMSLLSTSSFLTIGVALAWGAAVASVVG